VWDTSYAALEKPAARASDRLWADIAKPEWPLAGPALAALAAKPDAFVPLVRELLPAATKADLDVEAIAKWVEQLDDQVFAVRDRASTELTRLGRESLPLLREHLARATSAERKTRLRQAIDRVGTSTVPSAHLRERRAVALLEQLHSPGSQTELDRLVKGHPEALLTREAKAALERLSLLKAAPRN
jgi:hypothetical protein